MPSPAGLATPGNGSAAPRSGRVPSGFEACGFGAEAVCIDYDGSSGFVPQRVGIVPIVRQSIERPRPFPTPSIPRMIVMKRAINSLLALICATGVTVANAQVANAQVANAQGAGMQVAAVQAVVDGPPPTRSEWQSLTRRLQAVEATNARLRMALEGRSPLPATLGITPITSVIPASLTQAECGSACATRACGDCGGDACLCPPDPAPCITCPHVSTLNPYFNLRVFGSLNGELVLAGARPVIASGIVLISPDLGQDTQTAEVHAKSTNLGVALQGPEINGMQSGGLFLTYLYGERFQDDKYGLYIVRMYAELKNDWLRFAAGINGDVINPRAPTTVNFNRANGAGNLGFMRAQLLVESHWDLGRQRQLTTQCAVSNPVTTAFADLSLPPLNLLENNRWPNVEGRVAMGWGEKPPQPQAPRPFELGVSGLVGQLRRTDFPENHIHDVWAFGVDTHVGLTDRVGFNGEFFMGQSIGNYNAGIFLVDNENFSAVRSTGGWGEIYVNWTPCLRSHFGAGVDDPLNRTLTRDLPTKNELMFANVIWDATANLEIGFEVSYWKTSYAPDPALGSFSPLDNDAMVYQARVRLKF